MNRNEVYSPIRLAESKISLAVGSPHSKLSDRSKERELPHEAVPGDLLDGPGLVESSEQASGHEQAEATR